MLNQLLQSPVKAPPSKTLGDFLSSQGVSYQVEAISVGRGKDKVSLGNLTQPACESAMDILQQQRVSEVAEQRSRLDWDSKFELPPLPEKGYTVWDREPYIVRIAGFYWPSLKPVLMALRVPTLVAIGALAAALFLAPAGWVKFTAAAVIVISWVAIIQDHLATKLLFRVVISLTYHGSNDNGPDRPVPYELPEPLATDFQTRYGLRWQDANEIELICIRRHAVMLERAMQDERAAAEDIGTLHRGALELYGRGPVVAHSSENIALARIEATPVTGDMPRLRSVVAVWLALFVVHVISNIPNFDTLPVIREIIEAVARALLPFTGANLPYDRAMMQAKNMVMMPVAFLFIANLLALGLMTLNIGIIVLGRTVRALWHWLWWIMPAPPEQDYAVTVLPAGSDTWQTLLRTRRKHLAHAVYNLLLDDIRHVRPRVD